MCKTDKLYMRMAKLMAQESKCASKQVCALVIKSGRIVSSGLNGTLPGHQNCCDRADALGWLNSDGSLNQLYREQHRNWSSANELHAEQAALCSMAATGTSSEGCTLITTLSPCNSCVMLIIASGITRVVYGTEYEFGDADWKKKLESVGIEVIYND